MDRGVFWCYGVVVDGVGVVFDNIEYGLGCGEVVINEIE